MFLRPLKVISTASLESALRVARHHDVGLVLTEIELGDEDGPEVLSRLCSEAP